MSDLSNRDVVTPGSEANALALIHTNAFRVLADADDGPTMR